MRTGDQHVDINRQPVRPGRCQVSREGRDSCNHNCMCNNGGLAHLVRMMAGTPEMEFSQRAVGSDYVG